MAEKYLFIDGNYLSTQFAKQMHAFYNHAPPIMFQELGRILKVNRCYYYDAIDYSNGANETEAEQDDRIAQRESFHDWLAELRGFHVRHGHVRRSKKKSREQKAVDVRLAVDALEHAARGNIEKAVFLTGDLDFEPLLTSLERLGVRTKLLYVRSSTSPELIRAADESQALTLSDFCSWSPASFRDSHKPVSYSVGLPDEIPEVLVSRRGRWGTRELALYDMRGAGGRIFVKARAEVREPSISVHHADLGKVAQAFELAYGPIQWNQDQAPE